MTLWTAWKGSCFLLVAMPLVALAQASGTVSGVVVDAAAMPIDKALIEIEDVDTHLSRATSTAGNGRYLLPVLPPGNYLLTVTVPNRTSLSRGVLLGVAEAIRIDFKLPPRIDRARIEVTGDLTSLNPDETQPHMIVRRNALLSLPINGRDYARLSLLAPGALARSNQLADLSFNGLHSNHNQFSIDGVDATRIDQPFMANGAERGARLQTGSIESIAEVRVQTGNYQAEFGRAASAYVNIATRSGTNQFRVNLFEYLRHSALDARNFFNRKPDNKLPFHMDDFGFNMSGPIRRNSLFGLVNYEGARQKIGVIGAGTVPSGVLRQEVISRSPLLGPIVDMMPRGSVPTASPWVDSYSVAKQLLVREDTTIAKANKILGSRNAAAVRWNWNDARVNGPLFSVQPNALGILDRQDVPTRTINVGLSDDHIWGPRFVNQFLAGVQRVSTKLITDFSQLPLFAINGITIQPGNRGRSRTVNTSFQLGNTMSLAVGEHLLKWGSTVRNIRLNQSSSEVQSFAFSSLDDFANNRVASVTLVPGNSGSATWAYETGVFLQDTYRLGTRVTADIGVRYDRFGVPFDPQRRARAFDFSGGALKSPEAAYFRLNSMNFAPRFGLAWSVDRARVLRFGYGVYYQAFPIGLGAVPFNTIPGATTLVRQQFPGLSFPLNATPGSPAKPNVIGFASRKPDSYSQQWSMSISTTTFSDTVLEVAYLGNRGLHLRRSVNVNLFDPVLQQRPNNDYANVNQETASGKSSYESAEVRLKREITKGVSGGVQYTWSHAIDDVADPAVGGSSQPQDVRNYRAEKGNGSSDVRHRVSYYFLGQLPLGHGKWGTGWAVAGSGLLRSGVAQTIQIGRNTSGDGNLVNQRPDSVLNANPYPANRSITNWYSSSAFSLPSQGTFGNLARNTVRGPSFAQFDLSLLKDFQLVDHVGIQARVEVYNVFNHPNFAQPNAIWGTPAFGQIFSTLGNTTGLGTARQIQFALRLAIE